MLRAAPRTTTSLAVIAALFLALLLRARYAMPHIRSITKTDGLTYKVAEIVDGISRHAAYGKLRDTR